MLYGISKCWFDLLFSKDLAKIRNDIYKLTNEERVCPQQELWFNWARVISSPHKIKVVLIGMDPYPRLTDAHGLSFSSLSSVPGSLKNIYKCLEKHNYIKDSKKITSGDLTNWCKQGVLLLNTALTTEVGNPGKHSKIWKKYMMEVIRKISDFGLDEGKQFIFLLWGKNAEKLENYIDGDFHIIMKWLHPSPMAQTRVDIKEKFINCDHFVRVNEFLQKEGETPIIWDPRYNPDDNKDFNCYFDDENKDFYEDKNFYKNKKSNIIDKLGINYISGLTDDYNLKVQKVFTDGSCTKNGKKGSKGSYAAVFVSGKWKNTILFDKLPKSKYADSNIRAEGWAIIKVLEFLEKKQNWKICKIYTDSDFWEKMINSYMPKWSESDFKKKKNYDLTLHLWCLWNNIMNDDKYLEIVWVPAHNKKNTKNSKNLYKKWCYDNNNAADKLAKLARNNDM